MKKIPLKIFFVAASFLAAIGSASAAPRIEHIYGGGKSTSTKSVALLIETAKDADLFYVCSATFLSPTHLLTARHCVKKNGFKKPIFYIYRKNKRPIKVTQRVASAEDDVAIVTIPAQSDAVPVPILLSTSPVLGDAAQIYGYGEDQFGKSALEPGAKHFLKFGNITLGYVSNSLLGFQNASAGGACHGDSGGPMVALNGSNLPGVIGVASYATGKTSRCVAGNWGYYVNAQSPSVLNFIFANAPDATSN